MAANLSPQANCDRENPPDSGSVFGIGYDKDIVICREKSRVPTRERKSLTWLPRKTGSVARWGANDEDGWLCCVFFCALGLAVSPIWIALLLFSRKYKNPN